MQPLTVTRAELARRHNFARSQEKVVAAVQAAAADPLSTLRFFSRYTSWNGYFGSGVASLAGKIGRARGSFLDPQEPLRAVADRSVYVASFFFDAARDEFDDRETVHRDTHRCLAQALLKGVVLHLRERGALTADDAAVDALMSAPLWLRILQERVAVGYGVHAPDSRPFLLRAMGYHLGSEVLADQEFSLLDESFSQLNPALVADLSQRQIVIADQSHQAWYWLRVHSGHGGGVEEDHFQWAVQGLTQALACVPPEEAVALREQALLGFDDFARDHAEFFAQVNQP